MKLTEDDLSAKTEQRVHLDTWLKMWEWKQILDNQEKAEKWDKYLNYLLCDNEQDIYDIIESRDKSVLDKTDEIKQLKDSIEFQLDKHTGKVGYEYITKILKEILN